MTHFCNSTGCGFASQPYNLNDYEPGCGLRNRKTYANNFYPPNNHHCNDFHRINFHRKCTCYLKANVQAQCQCGMIPTLFHKLVSAPYTSLANSHPQKQQKKDKKKCKCKCKCKEQQKKPQKQNIIVPHQIISYKHTPEIINYVRPAPQYVQYNPHPVIHPNISFKTIPATSINNFAYPTQPIEHRQAPQIIQKQNTPKSIRVVQQVLPSFDKSQADPLKKQIQTSIKPTLRPSIQIQKRPSQIPTFPQTVSVTSIIKQSHSPALKTSNQSPMAIQSVKLKQQFNEMFTMGSQNGSNYKSVHMYGQKQQFTSQNQKIETKTVQYEQQYQQQEQQTENDEHQNNS